MNPEDYQMYQSAQARNAQARLEELQQVQMQTHQSSTFSGSVNFVDNNLMGYRWYPNSLGVSVGDPLAYSHAKDDKSEAQKNKVAAKVLDKVKASAKAFTVNQKDGDNGMTKAEEYRDLGLHRIATALETKANKVLKEFAISAAGYKRINRSELYKFNEDLYALGDLTSKRTLIETPLENYVGQDKAEGDMVLEAELAIPPADVLEALKVAKGAELFDAFSVLHIKYVPDPILCGKINESKDLYFIADWGTDVRLSDIVKE